MISTQPAKSFGQLVEQFPGIENVDPLAVGRFAFHAAKHPLPENVLAQNTAEAHEDWHDAVIDATREIGQWQQGYSRTSRVEMAQDLGKRIALGYQVDKIEERLVEVSADEGQALVLNFLQEKGCQIQTEMSQSPLFPDGRSARKPVHEVMNYGMPRVFIPHEAIVVDPDGRQLPGTLLSYLQDTYPVKRAQERVDTALAGLEPVSKDHFETLRSQYGAKAASLICFDERAQELNKQLADSRHTLEIKVPSFVPVGITMYEAWLAGADEYDTMLEQVRLQAMVLEDHESHGLVAVRSSALKSEDGEEYTGAGVYASMAADPRDPVAFRKAVEAVYRSARSEAARSYQAGIGVADEMMGLVVQAYRESTISGGFRGDMFYGHVNSSGANPNLIDLHTKGDMLLYDKEAVTSSLLMRERSSGLGSELLHTHPDRESAIYKAINQLEEIPHAVVLAERLFGRPMQVEFAGDAVVQVRPLIIEAADSQVSFPEDLVALSECAAAGVGDQELTELDGRYDISHEKGFVVFWQEYGFTIGGADYDSFPKEGAVIIMNPSSNGHIQAICREKGLLCFYPKKDSQTEGLDAVTDTLRRNSRDQETEPVKLRFVSDGYTGRIYES